jgi:hypothetical protein
VSDQFLRFRVDLSEIAEMIGQMREEIEEQVKQGVETLSIAAHAYITNVANTHFAKSDFKRQFYLGIGQYGKNASNSSTRDPRIDQTIKNLRWIKISDGLWVVELDEHAQWLEEGRPETFMGDWLLKPGAKGVKRAKDGSLYRAIPFKETENGRPAKGAQPQLAQIAIDFAKQHKISLKKIEKNHHGEAKVGLVRKLDIGPHDAQGYAPGVLYSKPRTDEDAAKSGLKPHGGIFKLAGAAVFQNVYEKGKFVQNPHKARQLVKDKKGKVKKETVVFRVISSKHKAEDRWMYPVVEPLNAFKQAENWANQQWKEVVLPSIERSFSTE